MAGQLQETGWPHPLRRWQQLLRATVKGSSSLQVLQVPRPRYSSETIYSQSGLRGAGRAASLYLLQHIALPQGHQPSVQLHKFVRVGLTVVDGHSEDDLSPSDHPALWDPTRGPAHLSLGLGTQKGLMPLGPAPRHAWAGPSSSGALGFPPTAHHARTCYLVIGTPLEDLLRLAAGLGAPPT